MTWLTTCLARCASYALDNRTDRKRVAREICQQIKNIERILIGSIYIEAVAQGVDCDVASALSKEAAKQIIHNLTIDDD